MGLLPVRNLSKNESCRKPISVLCLYPATPSKSRGAIAFMLVALHNRGAKLAVIAVKTLFRGKGKLPNFGNIDGVPVYRPYKNLKETFILPWKGLKDILKVANHLRPDLIFCSYELNMRLALLLQKYLKIPIVLLVENAGSIFSGECEPLQGLKIRCIMRLLGIPSEGATFWSWLCEKADALITSHPKDNQRLDLLSKQGKRVFYLPWPAFVPDDFELPSTMCKQRGIYAGSLSPYKNTHEFEWTLPKILENTYTKEFFVIGTGPDVTIIKKLRKRFSEKIKYIPQLSKAGLLRLISSSYYAYTPVKTGGWGFIGDCWGTRTPIVMTHNDGYVVDGSNALVAQNEDDLIRKINHLYEDPELYHNLQRNGYQEYTRRTPNIIGDKLYRIFMRTLDRTKLKSDST